MVKYYREEHKPVMDERAKEIETIFWRFEIENHI